MAIMSAYHYRGGSDGGRPLVKNKYTFTARSTERVFQSSDGEDRILSHDLPATSISYSSLSNHSATAPPQRNERDGLCLLSAVPKKQWASILTATTAIRLWKAFTCFTFYSCQSHGMPTL